MKTTLEDQVRWLCTVMASSGADVTEMESKFLEHFARASGAERTQLAKGMRQAINDMFRSGFIWIRAAEIDAVLAQKGLPSLEAMEEELNRKEAAMLRRGSIQNTEEFRIAMNLLNNLESGLTKKQRLKLGSMVAAFEATAAERGAED